MKNRLSESETLIYDVLETASILNKKGLLVTPYIKKAFGHSFCISCFTEVWFWGAFPKIKMDSNFN